MSKETFARELGAYHWERLERLADHYGHRDRRKYAVTLLKRAIEESEMWMRADRFAHYERLITELEEQERQLWKVYPKNGAPKHGGYDDDIPF